MLEASVAMQQAAVRTDVVCCARIEDPIRVSPVTVSDAAGNLFGLEGKTLIWWRCCGVGSWTVAVGQCGGCISACEGEAVVHGDAGDEGGHCEEGCDAAFG